MEVEDGEVELHGNQKGRHPDRARSTSANFDFGQVFFSSSANFDFGQIRLRPIFGC